MDNDQSLQLLSDLLISFKQSRSSYMLLGESSQGWAHCITCKRNPQHYHNIRKSDARDLLSDI